MNAPEKKPMTVIAEESDAQVKAALSRMRSATDKTIETACVTARQARTSSVPKMKAVRPVGAAKVPGAEDGVTEKFEAIRSRQP